MANRRSLHKKISLSEQVAGMSDLAQLAYTWAIAHADDWGTLLGSPRQFRAQVLPLRDDLSIERVAELIDEIVGAGLMVRYQRGDHVYLHYPTWDRHQEGLHKRTERTRLPLPGDEDGVPEQDVTARNIRDIPAPAQELPAPTPELPGNSLPREVKRTQAVDVRRKPSAVNDVATKLPVRSKGKSAARQRPRLRSGRQDDTAPADTEMERAKERARQSLAQYRARHPDQDGEAEGG